jgi:hypothetical protein
MRLALAAFPNALNPEYGVVSVNASGFALRASCLAQV